MPLMTLLVAGAAMAAPSAAPSNTPRPRARPAAVRAAVPPSTPAAMATSAPNVTPAPVAAPTPAYSPPPVAAPPPAAPAPTVNLDKLDSGATMRASSPKSADSMAWKAYFDLLLVARPEVADLTFANLHSFIFLDLFPSSNIKLSFDVNSSRGAFNYVQFDYQASPSLIVSAGKIWIPFDDTDPHNMFGGRTNVSDALYTQPGQVARFLPDVWTDLGVGIKYTLADTHAIRLVSYLYMVNGFPDGGTDPRSAGTSYPSFGSIGISTIDNNRDKALGGRLHALLGGRFGLGVSAYSGRWNDQTETEAKRTFIFGADAQLRLLSAEVRAGGVTMNTNLGNGNSFNRGGFYGELGVTAKDNRWKVLIREGSVSLDNRVESVTDQTIIGGKILYKPGLIQWSLEYSRDVQDRPGKVGKSLAAVRAVVEI